MTCLVRASKSSLIPAPARDIYALIADYHTGHSRMLPPSLLRRIYAAQLAQLGALFATASPAPK